MDNEWIRLDCQKGPGSYTESSQFLSESITIGAVQASIDICKQLIQSFCQLCLVVWRLSAQKMILVCSKARFTSQHKTKHWSHDSPVILWRPKQQQVEQCSCEARKEIWVCIQVLLKQRGKQSQSQ